MTVDIDALKAAQAQGLTVGVIPKSGGQLGLRLEIDDFIQDTELANLYFLAMESFMSDKASTSAFSYYEISGIHGQPHRPWDGVSSVKFPPSGGSVNHNRGYCSHGSAIFPTWHRAYLAQFEVN
jgi:tyrosinase